MKIIRATHLGMCFGVRDAIQLALKHSEKEKLTIFGELVHNQIVNETLQKKGIQIRLRLEEVETKTIMITAHGASQKTIRKISEQNHHVIEATCPLVHHAHRSILELVQAGYHPVIIGKRDHVEVRGLTEDLIEYDVIQSEEDVVYLKETPRFGIVAQTTQPVEKVKRLVDQIRQRFPSSEVRFTDTICQPTKQRQLAAVELAKQCDVVVIIGGSHSNNTKELTATCGRYCSRVIQIQNADELKPYWFYNAQTVGITAGTSTPDEVIDSVEYWLNYYL